VQENKEEFNLFLEVYDHDYKQSYTSSIFFVGDCVAAIQNPISDDNPAIFINVIKLAAILHVTNSGDAIGHFLLCSRQIKEHVLFLLLALFWTLRLRCVCCVRKGGNRA